MHVYAFRNEITAHLHTPHTSTLHTPPHSTHLHTSHTVCPQTQMSVPFVVETDRTATAYIKITAKPPPNVLPENLLVISIEGGQNINFTSSIVTPRLLKTNKALETVYKYQFEVSNYESSCVNE